MSAPALEAALRAHGLACEVEPRETLAVLVPCRTTLDLATAERRALAIRLAREHGFTHVAVELAPGGG